MQNKKSLLQRLLVIYITFFIVLAVSIAHSIVPEFSRSFDKGAKMGQDIASKWHSGTLSISNSGSPDTSTLPSI